MLNMQYNMNEKYEKNTIKVLTYERMNVSVLYTKGRLSIKEIFF